MGKKNPGEGRSGGIPVTDAGTPGERETTNAVMKPCVPLPAYCRRLPGLSPLYPRAFRTRQSEALKRISQAVGAGGTATIEPI
jgi:hypothetical protein